MTAPDSGLLSPVRAGTPVETVVADDAWVQAMLDTEAALVRAQAGLGTVPEDAARVISAVAAEGGLDVRALALASRETANPVVGLVQAFTRRVAQVDPSAAEFVHRGSTSQDVLDTAAMLIARRALRLIVADLDKSADALGSSARAHRDTPMAGRTLALHAVPTTFGLKAAGWRELLLDARRRLARVADEGLPVSLGGAAGTLAGYLEYAAVDGAPGDRAGYPDRLVEAFAAETGLAVPALPWHSLRTPFADLAAVLAFTAGALGRVAVDVQALARTEVGEVAEPPVSGRGASSAMPHKRNPVLSTMIRSAALQVPALAGALTQCMVTEDERSAGAWHAEWLLLRECLRLVGGAAHTAVELASGLVVDPGRMRANLDLTGSQIVSERIAARLTPRLGRARARELLTRASVEADASGQPLAAVLAGLLPEVPAEEVAELCDPTRYLGAAPALVDRALGD
ncbi:3-carboxy-cis,cis-muconate cycloisomerase [Streptomyces roseirectus]|uniref:3-carboxy-cis,cis-muconate cycloisomerase n=1 Tax=Streptomyces roseirectus TaxID=2768066 RepID=A0A7H0IMQ6_9ACTN|nr:3-carboxy-cis,cis-muconate cycloisomerase [Streptomyces roseirectus]QNP74072.1 3-carboxy-cis,cis-muconate cycloisomerase [Streptomyces roseirectus]